MNETNGWKEVIRFWFEEHDEKDWYGADEKFDRLLRDRFFDLHQRVAAGETHEWRRTPKGRLAEIIVLDQFSRQFFRGRAEAFVHDGMALVLAQELVALKADMDLDKTMRSFAYMPYMHSESLQIHDEAVRLFGQLGIRSSLEFEIAHRDIIARFGRFPMRNEALGRTSTREELEYIASRKGNFF